MGQTPHHERNRSRRLCVALTDQPSYSVWPPDISISDGYGWGRTSALAIRRATAVQRRRRAPWRRKPMSVDASTAEKYNPHQTATSDVKFSKEDALDCREFEQLVRGAISLDGEFAIQSEFLIMVCGRLGLRAGELTHMTEEWVNWRKDQIEIPAHQECSKGRDGGRCGYCTQLAKQSAGCNDDVDVEEALQWRWHPKTEAAVRAVPFSWNARVSLAMERFFDRYDGWPISKQGVNRRLQRSNDAAPMLDAPDLTPHNLRATAASKMAADGLDSMMIQGMLGWSDPTVSERYIRTSPENIARSLEQVARQ